MRYETGTLTKIATTFEEFVQTAIKIGDENETSHDKVTKRSSSQRSEFFGDAHTFDEMVKRCYDGYNAKSIANQRDVIAGLIDYERPRDELRFTGDALDVPTYLSGDMRCFWSDDGTGQGRPKMHITFSCNTTAGYDVEYLNHGGCIAVLCDALSDWADTKITTTIINTGVFASKGLQAIELKDYSEPIDVPRIGAVTHMSFFRRMGFAWFEGFHKVSGVAYDNTYGSSMTGDDRHIVVSDKEFCDWIRVSPDEIVIDLPAANDSGLFGTPESAAKWLADTMRKIRTEFDNGSRHIKLF